MYQLNRNGVVYLFAYSLGYAERIAISLQSLRRWWLGNVLILVDDITKDIALKIVSHPTIQAEIKVIEPVTGCRHSNYITKTLIDKWSPFEQTVFIDGDTTICGSIDELFNHEFFITAFSNWTSAGPRIRNRVSWWQGKSDVIEALVNRQNNYDYPAINTGVFGFHAPSTVMPTWYNLTMQGAGTHMTDEIAMQLLTGTDIKYTLLDDRYNCSPIYGVNKSDVRIWHFHGSKHLRKEECRVLWEPEFRLAMENNIGGIRDWAGQHDKYVRELLKGK